MGCSSGNASEEKGFQKTGDPKKDFFYCFDAQEIQIIEEKKTKVSSSPETDCKDLYSRFEIDYTKEKDENLILKQYIALYVKENYVGDISLEDIQCFHIKACDLIAFKINNKEATLPKFDNMNDGWVYCSIYFDISANNHVEPFKDLLILEITYKIKQYRLFNTRYINVYYRDDVYTTSMIIYYDKNKIEIISDDEENFISLKNGIKTFNRRNYLLWIRNKGKIKFSQEEEALIKKKFTSEEISNINTALEKIGALKEENNLIFEKSKYVFNNKGICKGEGKILILTNDRLSGCLNGCDFNLNLTELKVNDKLIEKKPEDFYEDDPEKRISYFKADNGANNTHLDGLNPLVIIEFKVEMIPHNNGIHNDGKYHFGFKNLFGVNCLSGGYYNYEIVANDAKLIFEPDEGKYKPKKIGNSKIYSGFYDVNKKEYDEYLKVIGKEYGENQEAEKERGFKEWMNTKKLEEFHPLEFQME